MIVLTIGSTKGGVGKTTCVANIGALLAHMGFRVLMIDADIQPALSKYFPISKTAPNGLNKLIREACITEDVISEISIPGMELPQGQRPVLDVVYSDSPNGELQLWLSTQGDRIHRLKYPIYHSPYMAEASYDFVIIDTQGAVGALQDAAVVAGSLLISPIIPETLSAREFLEGTREMIVRLSRSAMMNGIELGLTKGLIYRQPRTTDARLITQEIRREVRNSYMQMGGKVDALQTVVPMAKAYTVATSERRPVHMCDPVRTGVSPCAYEVMHQLIFELVPYIGDLNVFAPVEGADLRWLEQRQQNEITTDATDTAGDAMQGATHE